MTGHHVRLLPGDIGFALGEGQTVLAGAEAAGVTLPSSCRNGTCRTCICLMQAGQVRYLVAWPGLSLDEKKEGWILPCVAVPQSDLQLQAPAARRTGP